MTTSMIAWHCTMRTPPTTSTERERAFPLVCQRSLVLTSYAHTCTVAQGSRCLRLSPHPHGHLHVRLSSPLILPFHFLHFLTSLFFLLQFLKSVVNLHNSANESMDSTDEFSLSTVSTLQSQVCVKK